MEITPEEPQAKQPQLSRAQQRAIERANEAAATAIEGLTSQFLKFVMETDGPPDGPEVTEKIKELDAKWRMYCKTRNLLPTAFPILINFMNKAVQDYQDERNRPEVPELQPEAINQ